MRSGRFDMAGFGHFENLLELFFARASERSDAPFLWSKATGAWLPISWSETAHQVAALAAALRGIGLATGDRVMLVSENRPEWCIADLAIMAAGCVTVPAYATNTERDHQHVLSDSGATAVIVSTAKLAKPLLAAAQRSSDCEHVIAIEPIPSGQSGNLNLHDWSSLIAGAEANVAACAAGAGQKRSDLACIIYTSGTGGAPRGVMLSHGALLHNVEGAAEVIVEDFGWDEEVFLSFLPLSHAYEHTGGQLLPIGLGAQIYYAEGLEKLGSNIEEVRPTIMIVVPRLFEVFRQKVLNSIEKEGAIANYLLRRALALEAKRANGGSLAFWDWPMDALLERTLRPKVRAKFGGRVKAMVSGGAPLNPEVGHFFQALGITLLQGYGQTESAPIMCVNRPKAGIRMHTVGRPIRATEVRIAEDGEILCRGELVMLGYWRNDALTAKTIQDGWLYTGDIGQFDEDGRLAITDRKKDLIVLDKGDNVAPQRVEGMLTLQPEIAQAMVMGDRRPHLVGLIVPDCDWTKSWCKSQGKEDGPDLHRDPDYLRAISAAVDRVNKELSVIEKVRRFILADEPFTVDNKQLTPSIKIRRHVLKEVYGERLEALYRKG
jgi:long-chain acyl-CoA synthetase